MDKKDIIVVDHISLLTKTEIDCRKMEEFTIKMLNIRKYRGKIERRKLKINKIYE